MQVVAAIDNLIAIVALLSRGGPMKRRPINRTDFGNDRMIDKLRPCFRLAG